MHDDENGRGADGRPAEVFSESGGRRRGRPDGPVAAPEGPLAEASGEPPAEPPEGRPDEVSFGPAGATPQPPRARRRGRVAVYAIVVLAAAGLGTAAAVGLTSHAGTPVTGVSSHQVPGPQNDVAGGGSLRASAVAGSVDPGEVEIDALIAYSGGTSSEGTGMVISRDGLILTNNHVINGSNDIHVRLVMAGKKYLATVVGYDATQDVALLKISGAPELRPVSVGNSSQVTVGTAVVALGNAE